MPEAGRPGAAFCPLPPDRAGVTPAARWRAWPWPALIAWGLGWCLLALALRGGLPLTVALALGWAPSVLLACRVPGRWRRSLALAGLPAALLLNQLAAAWPAWVWLAPAAVLLALYPLSAWRDAPWFPTPPDALLALAPRLGLAPEARILDAGSGLGHGLVALRRAFPQAHLEGVERSVPLAWASALRRPPGVAVRREDLWSLSWSGFDLVYLFQRPESMGPAWCKACREQRPGTWLVSLAFPVPGLEPTLQFDPPLGCAHAVFAYRIPRSQAVRAQPAGAAADNGSGFRPPMKQQPR
jgi:hypothetical protein